MEVQQASAACAAGTPPIAMIDKRDFANLSDDDLIGAAHGFESCSDLQIKDRYLYEELKRRNLYERRVRPVLLAKSQPQVEESPYARESEASLLSMAQGYDSRMDLRENNPALLGELEERGLWDAALPRRRKKVTPEMVREVAKGYKSPREFATKDFGLYRWAVRAGLLESLFPGATERGRKWTEEAIIEAARQCTTRSEFHQRFAGAYAAARAAGILDEVCRHMTYHKRRKSPAGMTNAELMQAASKFGSPNEFLRGNRSAYNQSVRRGIFAQIAKQNGWQ
jgi:hypothetical protein